LAWALSFQLEPSPPNAAGSGNVQVGTAVWAAPPSAARKFYSSRTTESNFSEYESFYYNAGKTLRLVPRQEHF